MEMLPFEELQMSAASAIRRGNYSEADDLLDNALRLASSNESRASILYDRACSTCMGGNRQAAKQYLLDCAEHGYSASFWARQDSMLADIRNSSSFQQALLYMRRNLTQKLEYARTTAQPLRYEAIPTPDLSREAASCFRWTSLDSSYYKRLLAEANVPELTGKAAPEIATELALWVNNLWEHDGSNVPKHSDPLSILREVRKGNRFRCVEYATLFGGMMEAAGYRTRVVWLFTTDVAMRTSGASHVVAEVYMPELCRWFLVDVQWGYIPFGTDNLPLSTVSFREQCLRSEGVTLREVKSSVFAMPEDRERSQFYQLWILSYLCLYGVQLDQRYEQGLKSREMLLLLGESQNVPLKFQRGSVPFHWQPVRSLTTFYAPPTAET